MWYRLEIKNEVMFVSGKVQGKLLCTPGVP